jgi:hypothetical protein
MYHDLSLNMTYHQTFNTSNTTVSTTGAELITLHPSGMSLLRFA